MGSPPGVADGDLPADPVEVVVLEARHVTLFDSEVFLGVEMLRFPLRMLRPPRTVPS